MSSALRRASVFLFGIALLVLGFGESRLLAQDVAPYRMAPNKEEVEVDFLANYYSQDGDYGAPQGGIGTEQLQNIAGIFYVNVPIDSNSAISGSLGADYYSSASTDQIDRQVSGASSSDIRKYGNVTYTERRLGVGRSYRATLGVSQEYDVLSLTGALGFSQEWGRGQHEFSLTAQAFNDTWKLIYPTEFRRLSGTTWRGPLEENVRQSYALSAVYTTILTPRIQVALSADFVAMSGLLSTPFHRIYYRGNDNPALNASDIERLPSTRYRLPFSLRFNVKATDALVVRTLLRYYVDSWGIQAPSVDLELAYDLGTDWTVLPFGRYYHQRGSRYYAGFAQHLASEEFYSSDYDLATLTTTKVGIGLRYAPVLGLAKGRFRHTAVDWRAITLRGAYYQRDAGLQAYALTLATKVIFGRQAIPRG